MHTCIVYIDRCTYIYFYICIIYHIYRYIFSIYICMCVISVYMYIDIIIWSCKQIMWFDNADGIQVVELAESLRTR